MGNRHLSVLMLYVRVAIVPLLGIMVLLGVAQTGLFLWAVQGGAASLQQAVTASYCGYVWIVAIFLLLVALHRMQGGGYTVRRLRVSEHAAFLLHSVSCFLCFVLLWMAEVVIMTLLCRYFLTLPAADHWQGQTLFLAFYGNDFLHSVLPLEEISRWGYLISAFAALSFSMADAIVRQRYGSKPAPLVLTTLSVFWLFQRPLGRLGSDVFLMLFHLAVILYTIYDVGVQEEATADEAL